MLQWAPADSASQTLLSPEPSPLCSDRNGEAEAEPSTGSPYVGVYHRL